MANNVQYTIGFKADNSQAKKALQELSSAFEKLEKKQNMCYNGFVIEPFYFAFAL